LKFLAPSNRSSSLHLGLQQDLSVLTLFFKISSNNY
jgi:hypothetical protein